jgi:hypothetical protein
MININKYFLINKNYFHHNKNNITKHQNNKINYKKI